MLATRSCSFSSLVLLLLRKDMAVEREREEFLKMKRCELCKSAASMYCESDQASLCWDCDAQVHSANFLVARHSRSLLCHVCQSPTAWNACGAKLGRAVSACESCVDGCEELKNRSGEEEIEGGDVNEIDTEDDEYDDDYEEEEEVSADDEDGDIQVVPWSSASPPPAASSSSSEETPRRFYNDDGAVSMKRLRQNATDICSDDDIGYSSSRRKSISPPPPQDSAWSRDGEAAFVDSLRPSKHRRIERNGSPTEPPGSRTALTVESLKSFHEQHLTSGDSLSSAIVSNGKPRNNPGSDGFKSSHPPGRPI